MHYSEIIPVSSWKHDRDYYTQSAKLYTKSALISFIFSSVFWSIFFISKFQTDFWVGGLLLIILGIIFVRLRNLNLRNSYYAPSKI